MLESVNLQSDVAVFAQIENEVRFAIASNELKAGDKLPTVRAVAERLDVNPNTVSKAYRDLEVKGLVYTRRGMGIYIKTGIERNCQLDCYQDIIKKMHEVVSEGKAIGMNDAEIKAIAKACFLSDSSPYENPPAKILALARKK